MLRICNRPNSCRRKPIASRRTESTHHGSRSPALPTLHCTVPRSGGRSPGAQSVLIFEPPTSCTYHTFLYIAYRLVPIIHFYTSHIALCLSHIFITFSYIAYRVASTRPGHGGVESGNSELNAPHIMMCMDVCRTCGAFWVPEVSEDVFITGSARPGLLVKPARSPHTRRVQKIAQGKILSPF